VVGRPINDGVPDDSAATTNGRRWPEGRHYLIQCRDPRWLVYEWQECWRRFAVSKHSPEHGRFQ